MRDTIKTCPGHIKATALDKGPPLHVIVMYAPIRLESFSSKIVVGHGSYFKYNTTLVLSPYDTRVTVGMTFYACKFAYVI